MRRRAQKKQAATMIIKTAQNRLINGPGLEMQELKVAAGKGPPPPPPPLPCISDSTYSPKSVGNRRAAIRPAGLGGSGLSDLSSRR